ncbi:MAG: UvrD-helicase domain-containing protein [Bacteroidales bacterium]
MSAGSIHIISASAGTGKTYRLVKELEQSIARDDNAVRPECVVATTFTVKAAAELRERVRSRLLEAGQVDRAQRLGAARIGTVNSICAQLVGDFAFELGISPEVQVLDESAAEEAFSRALSSVVTVTREEDQRTVTATSDAGAALLDLAERWPELDWMADVRQIAALARANHLTPAKVRECGRRSVNGVMGHLPPTAAKADALERVLQSAIEAFKRPQADTTQATDSVVDVMRQALAKLRAGRPLSWWEWAKLAGAEPGAKSREAFEPVREAARGHERHPALRQDMRTCVESVFELAAQALEAYDGYKREWGLMDFVDQEVMALRLLGRPVVQEMLREQIDLVMVDEFQDTSPLQLDIFLALSRLSPRSVWVGDQKQSIYAFRGTDPALMDAAIDAIVDRAGAGAHETLGHSWRSRAELVRLTSDLFAPAFDANGIPADRVRLEPAEDIEKREDTMGPVVEGWLLTGTKTKDKDAEALAAAVAQLLGDQGVRVRDVVSDDERAVRARDVAILCRSTRDCERVTRALERAGIRAVRPRVGLMNTPEARLVLAALRLWVNPGQRLAAAEVGRLLVHADDADAWLRTVLEAPGKAYATQEEVVRIGEARARLKLAGPLEAFDEVMEAAGVREACLRWGREAQRLANLDALRALVHRYVATCQTQGAAATVAGLLTHLATLADDEKDDQATLGREDAVTVGTLHSAKGLEWPITVLHEIDSSHKPTALGVHVATERDSFDFDDPLGGRWIRYWPDPYKPRIDTPLHESVRGGPEHAQAEREHNREALRLLYVGWTRARDRVVLCGRPNKMIGDTLKLLRDRGGKPLISNPAPCVNWAGRDVTVQIRTTTPADPVPCTPQAGAGYDAAGPRHFPPATADISKLPGTGQVGDVETLAPPPFIQAPVEFVTLGTAVHAFLAGDRPDRDRAERLAMAGAVLERWSVQGSLRADALVAACDAFDAWAARCWPSATWHREWPVRLRQGDGTELAGYADLVLMDGETFVLVDHKCIGATRDEAIAAAPGYGGQVGAYADAIAKATGKRCGGCFVHLVAQGLIATIKP